MKVVRLSALRTGRLGPPASWQTSATLTEVFPCFYFSCKANARVKPAKKEHGPHSSQFFVLFYVLFVLFRSVYLCVYVYVCVCVCVCVCV